MCVPTPTAKVIHLLWVVFDNVKSKLRNIHKGVSGINNIFVKKWVWLEISECYSRKRI